MTNMTMLNKNVIRGTVQIVVLQWIFTNKRTSWRGSTSDHYQCLFYMEEILQSGIE